MKNRVWIVLLVISLGINIGFLLHRAWPKTRRSNAAADCGAPGWHASPMKQGLGLNSAQTRLMEKERRQVLAQAKPLQDELRRKRRELFLLLKGREIRDPDLDLALNEISRLQAAIEKMFILHSLKVKGFFSPVQLQKYESFFEQGLCPGMAPAASCPPGEMSGRRSERSGCTDMKHDKKVN